jgi:hypothetical protein
MKNYRVTFVGEYYTLTTTVSASDEDTAAANAEEFLSDHYAFDLANTYHDIETEEVEQ